jgi:hypothetical protein
MLPSRSIDIRPKNYTTDDNLKQNSALSLLLALFCLQQVSFGQSQGNHRALSVFVYFRIHPEAWQWFAAPPFTSRYGYAESLLRFGVAQRSRRWDWKLEAAQTALLDIPRNAISSDSAQSQLGFGGSFYAANNNHSNSAALFLKQAFVRYNFRKDDKELRLGRYEFFDGAETTPSNATMRWLQTYRVAQRLIGNFGLVNAQRSFDGFDGHYENLAASNGDNWDLTAMVSRADQGAFTDNGNPELNVDVQYLAFTRYALHQRLLWRAFGIGYHDGRIGVLKVDNRPLALRQTDQKDIRLGTYGGDFIASVPARKVNFDLVGWGLLQSGNWGEQQDRADAWLLEGGAQLTHLPTEPWLRGGWSATSGDNTPDNNRHSTFFMILPSPYIYARALSYNMMNNKDGYLELIDRPKKHLELRADLHWLELSSGNDLWYQGGGAFNSTSFGYIGRPSGGHSSFASIADISCYWQITSRLNLNMYYSYTEGKSVVVADYPSGRSGQYGFAELIYQWGLAQRSGR